MVVVLVEMDVKMVVMVVIPQATLVVQLHSHLGQGFLVDGMGAAC